MERYVAIDPGKSCTKVATYDEKNKLRTFSFLTRASHGDFRDDAIEQATCIVEWDGEVYKVGSGASTGAELDTSKLTPLHKIAVITALTCIASSTEEDVFHVAVGIPAIPWHNIEEREKAREYFFPDGRINVKYKKDSKSPVVDKTFTIKTKKVYPESIGAIIEYAEKNIDKFDSNTITGVLDIGSLNCNATLWTGDMELLADSSVTDELGSSALINNISQRLSTEFSRCDNRFVESLLKKSPEERCLIPKSGDMEVARKSGEVILEEEMSHASQVKKLCDVKRWSLDYMNLIAIGGTSIILREQLKAVFGDNIVILDDAVDCNAIGYLKTLYSTVTDKALPSDSSTEENRETKKEKKTA